MTGNDRTERHRVGNIEAEDAADVFAQDLRIYFDSTGSMAQYFNLARNRTVTGNVIFSPSAYLLFSLEYRRLESAPVVGLPATSNIIGIGAGYKF